MSEDKHLEEKDKIETEIIRSLSVAKMKEAHKQIEDIEKLRKQASISSISGRVSFCIGMIKGLMDGIAKAKRGNPNQKFDLKIGVSDSTKKMLNTIMAMYESICFDLQRTIDIKKEDFDRLFPKIKIESSFTTYSSIVPDLICLRMQLIDMNYYCLRLL